MSKPTREETWTVEPNPAGGFYVVESTAEGYRIPRGWTYPSRELGEDALPLVREGIAYPTAAQLLERSILRRARIAT